MMRASRLSLLLLSATAATAVGCAAPSEWNGLAGGSREDATLAAPRQLSPLSVSLVASARPHFRWELGEAMTGAVVELCRTRACENGPEKTFSVSGRELVVPEDLERGIWFWRLKGRGDAKVGTQTSPMWEIVVRGPAAHGESDAPTGSMLDIDGDGRADLVTVGDATWRPEDADPAKVVDENKLVTVVMVYLSNPDGTFGETHEGETWPTYGTFYDTVAGPNVSVAGGTDFDGDGFSDYANAGIGFDGPSGQPRNVIDVTLGGPKDSEPRGSIVMLPSNGVEVPSLGEAGDTNGDGFGDVFIGMPDQSFTAMGEPKRPGAAVVPLLWNVPQNKTSPAVLGAFDANADGITDLVAATSAPNLLAIASPGTYAATRESVKTVEIRPPNELAKAPAPAGAFASGDFDGDGVADLAYALNSDGKNMVCVTRGDRTAMFGASICIPAAPGETELGGSLTAADIEGDGRDELLASVKIDGVFEVRAMKLVDGHLESAPIGPKGAGLKLTTIFPGRPGKAKWAATMTDQQSIVIYEGTDLKQRLRPPYDVVRGFGRALR